MKDSILKPDCLKKFENGFSNFKTVRLELSGHFPQEEQPKEVADHINQFLNDNRRRIKGVSCLIV
jgi:pimeloyl-ACP methyl ester carboxylesterase